MKKILIMTLCLMINATTHAEEPPVWDARSSNAERARGDLNNQGGTNTGSVVNEATSIDENMSMKDVIEREALSLIEPYQYTTIDRKEPFKPTANIFSVQNLDNETSSATVHRGDGKGVTSYSLDQLRLIGVMWGVRVPKAMVMDPSRKVHIIKQKGKIGTNSGYIAKIREGEIVVVEPYIAKGRTMYSTRIIKIVR